MITFTEMKVRLTLTDEALGMAPKDRNVYEAYIASLAPDAETAEEEVARLGTEEAMDGRTKVFPRTEDGKPFLYDYQIRGMFKDSIGFLRRATGSECGKLKAYKKVVDGMIFVKDRINPFEVKGEMGVCQRPMRTAGPQGERVALAASESIPAGSIIEFTVQMTDKALMPAVKECLDFGAYHGLCEWRNSGKGRYTWEEI